MIREKSKWLNTFLFGDALKAIVCGEKMSLDYAPTLFALKDRYNCQLGQIVIYNGEISIEKM